MKKLLKNMTLQKITKYIFAFGALMGVLFGGSYHRDAGALGVLMGAIFWGLVSAFGFRGIYEFLLDLICSAPDEKPVAPIIDEEAEETDDEE